MRPRRILPSLLLLVTACSLPETYRAPSLRESLVHVQGCLAGRQAVLIETVIDATDAPEQVTGQDWNDMLLLAKATGRVKWTSGGPRTLVTVREVEPGDGADAAPPALGMGSVSISQGVASSGGGGQGLRDVTSGGQPVYAMNTNRAPGQLLAVEIFGRKVIDGKEQSIRYWYVPPKRIPSSGYTEWMRPTYQALAFAPPYVEGLLWSGKPMPVSEVDADAPRIRYTQIVIAEYWSRDKDIERARRMQALAHAAGVDPVVAGPRRGAGLIPGC